MMRPALALLPVALMAAAGCGSNTVEAKPEAPAPPPSPSASPSKPGAPGLGILPEAKDGDNYDACTDGRCEVKVKLSTTISFTDKSLGVEAMTVKKLSGNKVTLLGTGPGTSVTLGDQVAGKPATMNNLKVTVVIVRGEMAILRLAPK